MINETDRNPDVTDVYQILGRIESKQHAMCQSQDKMFYGLLGIIAAQIGVKILGTDPLLYVVISISALALALASGIIVNTFRRRGPVGRIGWTLIAFLVSTSLLEIVAFLRDAHIGTISAQEIYILRIIAGVFLLLLIWFMWDNPHIFLRKAEKSGGKTGPY